jgi:GMP synthase (glutamine-hydrolysing)
MSVEQRGQVMVIEPAVRFPNLDCFNRLSACSPLPLSYHLPALFGFASIEACDLESVRGAIVLGSAASVHDASPWQERLERWLRELWQRRVPTLGVCYGHQLIGHLLGARVGPAFADGQKALGFRRIRLEEPPSWAGTARELELCVSHREAVLECPPELRAFASSQELAFDGIAHRELPIFGLQAHPEATAVFLDEHGISRERASRLADGHALLDGFLSLCGS